MWRVAAVLNGVGRAGLSEEAPLRVALQDGGPGAEQCGAQSESTPGT